MSNREFKKLLALASSNADQQKHEIERLKQQEAEEKRRRDLAEKQQQERERKQAEFIRQRKLEHEKQEAKRREVEKNKLSYAQARAERQRQTDELLGVAAKSGGKGQTASAARSAASSTSASKGQAPVAAVPQKPKSTSFSALMKQAAKVDPEALKASPKLREHAGSPSRVRTSRLGNMNQGAPSTASSRTTPSAQSMASSRLGSNPPSRNGMSAPSSMSAVVRKGGKYVTTQMTALGGGAPRDRRTIEEIQNDLARTKLQAGGPVSRPGNMASRSTVAEAKPVTSSGSRLGNQKPKTATIKAAPEPEQKKPKPAPGPSVSVLDFIKQKNGGGATPPKKTSSSNASAYNRARAAGAPRRHDPFEEEDDDMDDFIADEDEEEEEADIRNEIWKIMGKDKRKYAAMDVMSDDEDMEATGVDVWREESKAARLARLEDEEEERREAERAKQKRLKKLRKD
ncbi:SPT2-domain-containing protein [Saitoella complicata NRRL Y-17804]|uniref:SPT2 chromatin protein n=1 Tax=Saitoella complicata (strain BCRC 22490 / CBS 7301 / JCM 7358 / NBRC 10748 / NRRL Y-17804) TaxID=698492 RepID=A0A0E9NSX7_SAICN|nr:SPT2-domain-containing protein [Saitoella complicata NRRL Y-17804]ODQ52388.1 SPT2-domain-containing protein [Saitoella complicata NRRL Y-17804]GAO52781.1 hypothetical protein G7K_6848-t1 [Saitoella complicata NRRL Y-17804]